MQPSPRITVCVVFDVEEVPTHGGSLRVYLAHDGKERGHTSSLRLIAREERSATRPSSPIRNSPSRSARPSANSQVPRRSKDAGKKVVGYGAPGKGNTLLNYCGIRTDFLDYTVDRNPHKQGKFLPGTRIPIHAPSRIFETRPDDALILPWNLAQEYDAPDGADPRMGWSISVLISRSSRARLSGAQEEGIPCDLSRYFRLCRSAARIGARRPLGRQSRDWRGRDDTFLGAGVAAHGGSLGRILGLRPARAGGARERCGDCHRRGGTDDRDPRL